jgi:hypothetical protein
MCSIYEYGRLFETSQKTRMPSRHGGRGRVEPKETLNKGRCPNNVSGCENGASHRRMSYVLVFTWNARLDRECKENRIMKRTENYPM